MICEKNECTGCSACLNICPVNAISMEKDNYGNIYPIVDKSKCINCDMCKKVCPVLKEKLDLKEPINAYAMYNKNVKQRLESTSGGLATLFYKKILEENGVVYGASNLFGKNSFGFVRVTDEKELYKVRGSKYVHVYIDDIYRKVKNDLLNNQKVLFIGTPCQVSGLKNFLFKEYENLYTVDLICHGVPSQQLLFDSLNELKIRKEDVKVIVFRDNHGFNIKIINMNDEVIYSVDSYVNDYYRNFLEGNIYRENCYSCKYARKERISDVTVGDFWGLAKDSSIYDDEKKGISLVMPITDKGLELVNKCLNDCHYELRTVDEACKKNGQLNHPMNKSQKYKIYLNEYPKIGFKKTMKKMLKPKEKIKVVLKKNKVISKLYRIIKKK